LEHQFKSFTVNRYYGQAVPVTMESCPITGLAWKVADGPQQCITNNPKLFKSQAAGVTSQGISNVNAPLRLA
jgi:hypothetical protein